MEFKNFDKRILLLLAKKWKEKGTGGPYRTSVIYKVYADLPDEYISRELKKLTTEGFITFTANKHRLYLTDKGISQIQSFISNDRWNSRGV
jgi:predicted transcriptional regulator